MKILITPHKLLRKKSTKVTVVDQKLLSQIEEMFVLLKNSKDPEGVGLAAPQVGINKRFFIILDNGKREVFINPVITHKSQQLFTDIYTDDKDRWYEGCLSIPKIWGFVDRPNEITVEYQVLQSTTNDHKLITKRQHFSGLESSCMQHEIDHLDGILFTDRILEQKGEILQETKTGLIPLELVPTKN